MLLQPGEIFFDFGSINDEQKLGGASSVDDQVINHTSVVIEQKSVLALTDVQLGDVIGQHGIEPVSRAVSRDHELSHMGDIEHSHRRSHSLVFVHDSGVLDWHKPAAEWNHSRSQSHVFAVKRRFFIGGAVHARKVSTSKED
jgi:hypothetical protein